jgi:hypothetical protein
MRDLRDAFKGTNPAMPPLTLVNTVIDRIFKHPDAEFVATCAVNDTGKSFVDLREDVCGLLVQPVYRLGFRMYFINLMLKHQNQLATNYKDFYSFLAYVVHTYTTNKHEMNDDLRGACKVFMNALYGCINHPQCLLKSRPDFRTFVSKAGATITEQLFGMRHAIYADCDEVFFTGCRPDDIQRGAEGFGIRFDIDTFKNGVFFQKKKFCLNVGEAHGFRRYN